MTALSTMLLWSGYAFLGAIAALIARQLLEASGHSIEVTDLVRNRFDQQPAMTRVAFVGTNLALAGYFLLAITTHGDASTPAPIDAKSIIDDICGPLEITAVTSGASAAYIWNKIGGGEPSMGGTHE